MVTAGAAIGAVAAIGVSTIGITSIGVIIFAHLLQAALQLHIGTDQQIARLAIACRAQAALVEGVADRFGQLRRFCQGAASR
ncbi:hypothetical protein D3C75_1074680 [compost metagenome]